MRQSILVPSNSNIWVKRIFSSWLMLNQSFSSIMLFESFDISVTFCAGFSGKRVAAHLLSIYMTSTSPELALPIIILHVQSLKFHNILKTVITVYLRLELILRTWLKRIWQIICSLKSQYQVSQKNSECFWTSFFIQHCLFFLLLKWSFLFLDIICWTSSFISYVSQAELVIISL